MSPQQAYRNVKAGMTQSAMEKGFFTWLKANKTDDLLAMQKNQLFGNSEGADNIKLGSYSSTNKRKNKTKGMPFTMIDTGELFNKMKVVIRVSKKEIDFVNTRQGIGPDTDTNPETNFRYGVSSKGKQIFDTPYWFGLTDEHFMILDSWALEYSIQWTLNKFATGNGTVI
jgi:hypothetical protein